MENFHLLDGKEADWLNCIKLAERSNGWTMPTARFRNAKAALGEDNVRLLIAVHTESNDVIGFCETQYWAAAEDQADGQPLVMFGLYFVAEEHRRRGIGTRLFEAAIKPLVDADCNIGLMAELEMGKKYAVKYGFDKMDVKGLARHIYHIPVENIRLENLIDFDAELGDRICDIPDANMKKLLAFEAESNPAIRRGQSATVLFSDPMTVIKILSNKLGDIIAFCQIEKEAPHLRTRVWYARNQQAAEAVLKATLQAIGSLTDYRNLRFSIPFNKLNVKNILQRLNNETVPAGEGTQYFQFTKYVPKINFDNVYAIHHMNFA